MFSSVICIFSLEFDAGVFLFSSRHIDISLLQRLKKYYSFGHRWNLTVYEIKNIQKVFSSFYESITENKGEKSSSDIVLLRSSLIIDFKRV